MKTSRAVIITGSILLITGLAGCDAGASSPSPSASPGESTSIDESASPTASAAPTRTPSPTPSAKPVEIGDDCEAILSDDVLAQLEDVPLNDPAFGPSGALGDGSLLCIWGDPGADTTGLTTQISYIDRGPALDQLNALMTEEGFSCYEADDGTRCEKSWENDTYPVTDGRTLFWRQNVLIDTRYSNLSPNGYTSSIVENLFD